MGKIYWTGHPFVDAGLASIAAVLKVNDLREIEPDSLSRAVKELKRVLLSNQSLGLGANKSFAKGTLRALFPDSELANPSSWKGKTEEEKAKNASAKFSEAIDKELKAALSCLSKEGEETCSTCGRRCSMENTFLVRKDKMPLLKGIVNFYPAFSYGVRICGVCALALRFLPMSTIRIGGALWILHTQELALAKKISELYGWNHLNKSIAKNEPLSFFSRGQAYDEKSPILQVLLELLIEHPQELRQAYESPLPTTAYIFSNDNRGGYLQPIQIPNELLIFLSKFQVLNSRAFIEFKKELLDIPDNLEKEELKKRKNFVKEIAKRIIDKESIIKECLVDDAERLIGGWLGHRLYLQEVRNLPKGKIAILESLGINIAQSGDSKRYISELRNAKPKDLYGIFLNYVREKLLTWEEFYTLLPPNEYSSASELRDILLAVIYEWKNCQDKDKEFPAPIERLDFTPDETIKRIQEIGEKLLKILPNPSRFMGELRTADNIDRIRSRYLLAVQNGAISFQDFLFLAPLGDRERTWLLRDYLLAFLFDHARELSLQVDIEKDEGASSFEKNI